MILVLLFLLASQIHAVERTNKANCQLSSCLEPEDKPAKDKPAKYGKEGVVSDQQSELQAIAVLSSSLPSGTVKGTAFFYQTVASGIGLRRARIQLELSGFPATSEVTLKGWHIHQLGNITDQKDGKCLSTGGHYNPDNVPHGEPTHLSVHHKGDLGNLQVQPDGTATFDGGFSDVDIIGFNSVIGRTLVIHLKQDDLGLTDHPNSTINGNSGARVACGVIGWANSNVKAYSLLLGKKLKPVEFKEPLSAVAILQPSTSTGTVLGQVTLTKASLSAPTEITVTVSGLPAQKKAYKVGWHIHELGNLSPKEGPNGLCGSTGAHYNPENVTHGAPKAKQHHKGDLGNLPVKKDGTVVGQGKFDDVDLNGPHSVIGRAIVIHAEEDDLGKDGKESKTNGNSGARVACGVIGWAKEPGEALRLIPAYNY